MQFKPDSDIVFSYEPNKHLASVLTVTNNSTTPYMFKFKASNPTKISIKPSPYILKPKQEIKVSIAVHREVVPNIASQQIQILYGVKDYTLTKNFNLLLQNGSKNDMLNLTVMVQEKQNRNKLQAQMKNYKFIPSQTTQGKKGNTKLTYALVAVIGLVLGYFSPLNVFSL